MTFFAPLYELIMQLPSYYIRVGPAEIMISAGGVGWAVYEIKVWRKHR